MTKIIVCVKLVIDPETPISEFKIDAETKKLVPPAGSPLVANPFDENALEAALRFKDAGDCEVTVVSLGRKLPKAVLQRTMAVGADRVISIEDPSFDQLDAYNTAAALGKAIENIGEYDLIFTGRQSADWDGGAVWAGIAELLGIPSVTLAQKAELKDDKVIVERALSDGVEVVEAQTPALITFSNEVGELRYFALPDLLKAKKKEILRWSASDIEYAAVDLVSVDELSLTQMTKVHCIMITGADLETKGANLAKALAEENLIYATKG